MKFVFDKRFKFEEYPEIMKCHNEYDALVNSLYEKDDEFDNGLCKKEDIEIFRKKIDDFYWNEYAFSVFKEFYGKGLVVSNWETKKQYNFDEKYSSKFEELSIGERDSLVSLVEIKYAWKLPKEFYK